MVQLTAIFMGCLMFALGLVLGLVFHLPGTSSPGGGDNPIRMGRHPRDIQLVRGDEISVSTGGSARKHSSLEFNRAVEEDLAEITLEDVILHNQKQSSQDRSPFNGESDGTQLLSETQLANSNKDISSDVNKGPTKKSTFGISSVTDSHQAVENQNNNQPATRTVTVKLGNAASAVQRVPAHVPFGTDSTFRSEQNATSHDNKIKENNANYKTSSGIVNHTYSNANLKSIVNGVYWSSQAEALAPRGFTEEQVEQWRHKLQNNQIVGVTDGCGRMQNRQLMMSDATKACARYRLNTDQIQGEIYSYYLSRVLGLSHVPPSLLVMPDPRADLWRRVNQALSKAKWAPDKVAIVTPWVEGLQPAYIPKEFQTSARKLAPTAKVLKDKSKSDIQDLVQWSDLIVFDYLTANLDRVINNMYNEQWNPDMMRSPAHNLERHPISGLLVFLDNESGLFHSYRLLDKYSSYHKTLLSSLCVFRQSTADKIKELHDNGQVGTLIMDMFKTEDPLHRYVPRLPDRTVSVLQKRISDIHEQISHCKNQYDR